MNMYNDKLLNKCHYIQANNKHGSCAGISESATVRYAVLSDYVDR